MTHVVVVGACQVLANTSWSGIRRASLVRRVEEIVLRSGQSITAGAPVRREVVSRELGAGSLRDARLMQQAGVVGL